MGCTPACIVNKTIQLAIQREAVLTGNNLQHIKLWTVTELLSAGTGVCGEHGKGVIVDWT